MSVCKDLLFQWELWSPDNLEKLRDRLHSVGLYIGIVGNKKYRFTHISHQKVAFCRSEHVCCTVPQKADNPQVIQSIMSSPHSQSCQSRQVRNKWELREKLFLLYHYGRYWLHEVLQLKIVAGLVIAVWSQSIGPNAFYIFVVDFITVLYEIFTVFMIHLYSNRFCLFF